MSKRYPSEELVSYSSVTVVQTSISGDYHPAMEIDSDDDWLEGGVSNGARGQGAADDPIVDVEWTKLVNRYTDVRPSLPLLRTRLGIKVLTSL